MPFSARVIEAREDIPEIFGGNAVKVLEKGHVSSMIGLLEQLNQVSKFASEVFADILKNTEKNNVRIQDCKTRISRIDNKVAPIEKMFIERAPSYFYDNPYPGKEWKRRDPVKGLIFRRDRSSMEVNRRRNEADPPPNLSALDNYSKMPCIKKFTDSNFFMNEWMEAEKKKIEEEKAKRKARKRKRKKKREQKKTIQKIKVKKYDPTTGKMIEVAEEQVLVKQYTLTGDVANVRDIDYGKDDEKKMGGPPRPNNKIGNRPPPANIPKKMNNGGPPNTNAIIQKRGPPLNPVQQQGGPPAFKPKIDDIKDDIGGSGPSGPPGGGGGPPAFNPSKPPVFNPGGGPPPNPIGSGPGGAAPPPNPMMQSGGNAPPPNPYSESAHAPPPNPYAMEASIPERKLSPMERAMKSRQAAESRMVANNGPPKPKMQGMKSNLLLASIKKGKNLRKANTVKRKVPQDQRSKLMSALRGGAKLRKTASIKNKPAPKKKEPENEGIFAILNRRQYIADDDSDSDSDSGSWEDDD